MNKKHWIIEQKYLFIVFVVKIPTKMETTLLFSSKLMVHRILMMFEFPSMTAVLLEKNSKKDQNSFESAKKWKYTISALANWNVW